MRTSRHFEATVGYLHQSRVDEARDGPCRQDDDIWKQWDPMRLRVDMGYCRGREELESFDPFWTLERAPVVGGRVDGGVLPTALVRALLGSWCQASCPCVIASKSNQDPLLHIDCSFEHPCVYHCT